MSDIKIDSASFYGKIQKLYKTWKDSKHVSCSISNDLGQGFKEIDAFVVVMGKVQDEPIRPQTSDFL